MKNPFLLKQQKVTSDNHTLFLNSSALQVGSNAGQLEVREGKTILESFPIVPLKRLILFGNPQITTQAVKACLKNGVCILYHDCFGGFLGMTDPMDAKDVDRRLDQYRLAVSEPMRLAWSKALIRAKIHGAIIEFRRMVDNHWHPGRRDFNSVLRRIAADAEKAETLSALSGAEGLAAREYFSAFGKALPQGRQWHGRSYHPAADPANALLSFTYGIARGLIAANCRQRGLDTGICFMHRGGYGSGGLATDLIEPLRHAWCDHQVLYALHHHILDSEDFDIRSEGCRLSEDGRAKYLALCSRRLLPQLEKQLRKMLAAFTAALEHPELPPDFTSVLPER